MAVVKELTKETWLEFLAELEREMNKPPKPLEYYFFSQEAYDTYEKTLKEYFKIEKK